MGPADRLESTADEIQNATQKIRKWKKKKKNEKKMKNERNERNETYGTNGIVARGLRSFDTK